ncbi:Thaumatin-like protein [Thalictrum thalictroides]|uniref:Thaumatin-like protein n=1 Tax=Thalictrum thalictroides TaxID=46969 RepID=A0A7J6VQU7_THATH|nr:Thaumatin-like protein [Thalictrum thalictroides]
MDFSSTCWLFYSSIFFCFVLFKGTSGATFTFLNNCDYTVWPGILANSGSPKLETTGFTLEKGTSRLLQASTGWSGRFWGRTSCNFDESGQGSCLTGDCGSGQIECNGAGATPPATLAEFTLGSGSQDFYDVSLVDGYNLPMVVEGTGGIGTCAATGCVTDLNRSCPTELRVGEGEACKSACEAFGTAEYCCSGAFNTPTTCKPSVYSVMFKTACPRSYSYAYDDATSTFTCTGADYIITFCPSYGNSQKSSTDPPPRTTEEPTTADAGTVGTTATTTTGPQVVPNEMGSTTTSSSTGAGTGTIGSSEGEAGGVMLADSAWIAGLATGDSTRTISSSVQSILLIAATTTMLIFPMFHCLQ